MIDIFPHIVQRVQDSVFTMCLDMNSYALEAEYVIPTLQKIDAAFRGLGDQNLLKEYIKYFECGVFIHSVDLERSDGKGEFFLHSINADWRAMRVFSSAYNLEVYTTNSKAQNKERAMMRKIAAPLNDKHDFASVTFLDEDLRNQPSWITQMEGLIPLSPIECSELKSSSTDLKIKHQIRQVKLLHQKLTERQKDRRKSIDEIFSL